MKKKFKAILTLVLTGFLTLHAQGNQKNVVDYVNPLMGTDSKISLSNGNTYPAIALP